MKKVSLERFFSSLKEFLDLKKLGTYGKKMLKSMHILSVSVCCSQANSKINFKIPL